MNKADQIQYIAFNAGICKSEAEKSLKLVGEMVKTALSGEDGKPIVGAKVKIDGLGTYYVSKTAAKKGTNPQVAAAMKAQEAGTADEKQTQLLKAVKEGLVQAEYEKPEGTAIKFKPEAALKLWAGAGEDEGDESGDAEPTDAPAEQAPAEQVTLPA